MSTYVNRVFFPPQDFCHLNHKESAVDGKWFLESNASSIRVRLGYVKVPRIEEEFDSRNLLLSTALDPKEILFLTENQTKIFSLNY